MRRDDALPDRVVPACDVADDRLAEPPRGGDERHDAGVWRLASTTASQRRASLRAARGHVPPRAEIPPLDPALDPGPARQRVAVVEVEERIAVPVCHPLDVEGVPLVEADRERPEPELAPRAPRRRAARPSPTRDVVGNSSSRYVTAIPRASSSHSDACSRDIRKTSSSRSPRRSRRPGTRPHVKKSLLVSGSARASQTRPSGIRRSPGRR